MGFFDNINLAFNGYYYGNSMPYFSYPTLFNYSFRPSQSYGYDFSSPTTYSSYQSSYQSSGKPTLGSLTSARSQAKPVARRSTGKYCGKGSEYGSMGKSFALQKAKTDSRLEFIGNGGKGWSISDASFRNDIKYATRGTSGVLDGVVSEIRKTDPNFSLLVTSALGTATSPHSKKAGHYNVDSVKLDFGGGMSKAQATKVARQLYATGKFDFADPECDGATWHIDAQIKKEFLA